MDKAKLLYKWLYYLSIPLFCINVWFFFSVIIYAGIAESYGHYSFTEVILLPEHIFIFIFSVLSILFFISETIVKLTKKLIPEKLLLLTFVLLIISPTMVFFAEVFEF